MRKYDLTVLLKTDLTPEAREAFLSKMEKMVKAMGGTVGKTSEMGTKQMAYKIKQASQADYISWVVELPAEGMVELQKKLTVEREILRHLVVSI